MANHGTFDGSAPRGRPDDGRRSPTRRGILGASAVAIGGFAGCLDAERQGTERPTPGEPADPRQSPTTASRPEGEAAWGEISYPLPGNVRSTAGTLIVHFRIEAPDLEADPGPWYYPDDGTWYRFRVVNLQVTDESSMLLYWFRGGSGRGGMHAAFFDMPGDPQSMPVHGVSADWEPFESHWIAYTWDEAGTQTYWLDGAIGEQQGTGADTGLGPVGTTDGS